MKRNDITLALVAVGASMTSVVISRDELQQVYESLLPFVPGEPRLP